MYTRLIIALVRLFVVLQSTKNLIANWQPTHSYLNLWQLGNQAYQAKEERPRRVTPY